MKKKLFKLDIACGSNKQKGFKGIDIIKKGTQADIEHNLLVLPWPIKDNSVDEIHCSHFIEHLPHGTDGFNDPFWDFFNEIGRILKPGGKATFITPYYASMRAFQDPTHQRFITEATYLYLSKEWRKLNKLEHYPVHTNFKIESINHAISEELNGRAQEAIQYAAGHYWNCVNDLHVVLSKSK